ncbi:phosphoribosylglycinamide formyltransferase [archaeon]|nr:phosphoribosylglycinamide formyltransferase [archaeon]
MTLKIGVLGSTNGTDMQAIIDAINSGKINAQIVAVISDKPNAYILQRAKQFGLNTLFIDPTGKEKEQYDQEINVELEKQGVELLLLVGYMKIMSGWFVNKWYGKAMNIHPSILPAFGGGMDKDVHQTVMDAGVKITGCTLHFVTEEVDSGPIIAQKAVEIGEKDTIDTLKAKVQLAEQEIILRAINWFKDGRIKLEGNKVRIHE